LLWNRLYDPFLPIHEQPEEVFIDVIRLFHIDSTEQMLKSPELRALVLPIVRAEFEMASKYRYRQEEPWNFPITCFKGENDLYVTRTDILSWSRFTTSSFQVHIRQGEHFLLVDDRDFLMRAINRDLADYSPRASVATIGLPGVNQLAEWRPNSDSHGKPQLTNEPTAQPV
jgi:surfactin synthase thioesterase subunit